MHEQRHRMIPIDSMSHLPALALTSVPRKPNVSANLKVFTFLHVCCNTSAESESESISLDMCADRSKGGVSMDCVSALTAHQVLCITNRRTRRLMHHANLRALLSSRPAINATPPAPPTLPIADCCTDCVPTVLALRPTVTHLSTRSAYSHGTMPYPNRSEVHDIFLSLSRPPSGADAFFTHVHDDVVWTVTGQSTYSGTWYSKVEHRAATWDQIGGLLAEPGFTLLVDDGAQGIIVGEDGWVVVEMRTVDTKTKSGVPYNQHYSWTLRFDTDHKIVEVKAYLDLATLEKVLGGEKAKQEQEKKAQP